MNALARALKNRWKESTQGLIHHSDQGVQYASQDYVVESRNYFASGLGQVPYYGI